MERNMFLASLQNSYSFSPKEEGFLTKQINGIILSAGGNINEFLFIESAFQGSAQELIQYKKTIRNLFNLLACKVKFISDSSDPTQSVKNSKAIAVGGGSLSELIKNLSANTKNEILKKVTEGTPYVGINAGGEFASPATLNAAPATINCINAVPFQFLSNYIDSPQNRVPLQTFLIQHKEGPVKVQYLTAMTSVRDGSGIRMEDDDAGMALPDSLVNPPTPMFLFKLDQHDQMQAITFDPNNLNIILSLSVD